MELSSATNNVGLFVNRSDITTSEILSLSSFLRIFIKSLILVDLFSSFFGAFFLSFDKSTFPFDIDLNSLKDATSVGITAGASAPEEIVQEVISFLVPLGFNTVRNLSENNENMTFKLPKELTL